MNRVTILLCFLAIANAQAIRGGFKPFGKYVYNYTANVEVALDVQNEQWTGLKINTTAEFDFLPNNYVLLSITNASVWEVVLDPKFSFYPNTTKTSHSISMEKFLGMPVRFSYDHGLVEHIYTTPDDPLWSVNIKKGIINLMHFDALGKDEETNQKFYFVKKEMSAFGTCTTAYTMKDYATLDGVTWKKVGMNVTKTIDHTNCTRQDHLAWDNIIHGPLNDTVKAPLKQTTVIKYNMVGNELRFKLETVEATSTYSFVPMRAEDGAIVATSIQTLVYLYEGASTMKRDKPSSISKPTVHTNLTVTLGTFDWLTTYPTSPTWKVDLATDTIRLIEGIAYTFTTEVNAGMPLNRTMPQYFLRLINYMRRADRPVLNMIWQHCVKTPHQLQWFIYGLSMTGTEESLLYFRSFVDKKSISTQLIGDFMGNVGFINNPNPSWILEIEYLCKTKTFMTDPYLNQTCPLVISNLIKGFCDRHDGCLATSHGHKFLDVVKSYLDYIITCIPDGSRSCWTEVQTMSVLVAVENLGSPHFWPQLKTIATQSRFPLGTRIRAIRSCKNIIHAIPTHVRFEMFQLFRNPWEDIELRMVAFSVLMENPSPSLIKLCASTLYMEPSREVRAYVWRTIYSMAEQHIMCEKIYNACVVSMKLYWNKCHHDGRSKSQYHSFDLGSWAPEMHGVLYKNMIFTNKSSIPRFFIGGLNLTAFGQTISVIDGDVRVEGMQEFMSRLFGPSGWTNKKKSWFDFLRKRRDVDETVEEEIEEIQEKMPVVGVQDEKLKVVTTVRLFGRAYYFNMSSIDTNVDWKDLLLKGSLFKAASLEREFRNGKTFEVVKPFIPMEMVHTFPTIVGIPLTVNFTGVALARIYSKVKAEVTPSLFSPVSLFTTTERDSVKGSFISNITAVWQELAGMYFKLPMIETGFMVNRTLNFTKTSEVDFNFDLRTREFTTEVHLPNSSVEVLSYHTELYNYIKPEATPSVTGTETDFSIRKHNITIDQYSTFQIISNDTTSWNSTSKYAKWAFKMSPTEYMCVHKSLLTACDTPYYFNVIFHGRHRRIVTLYAPDHGFVTLSPYANCLVIKQTPNYPYGKLFVVENVAFNTIRMKTIVKVNNQLDGWPAVWGWPTKEDYYNVKETRSLFMKEHVKMVDSNGNFDWTTPSTPKALTVRVVFLSIKKKAVCVTPKLAKATNFTKTTNWTYEDQIQNLTVQSGIRWFKAWGMTPCLHGYTANVAGYPLLKKVLQPMDLHVWLRPNSTDAPKTIRFVLKMQENTWHKKRFTMRLTLTNTHPKRQVMGGFHMYKSNSNWNFFTIVQPTHTDLLWFDTMCMSTQLKPDNITMAISLTPNCSVANLKLDVVTPKTLPRNWLTVRTNYTYKGLHPVWQDIFTVTKDILHPIATCSASNHYWYDNTNTTGYNNFTNINLWLTTPNSMNVEVKTDYHTYTYDKIELPNPVWSFPKGTKMMPLATKLQGTFSLEPRCYHHHNTFTTFDKLTYNYNISSQKCDHILLRNCTANVTNFMVLVKRHPMDPIKRVLTMYIETMKVELFPVNATACPDIYVNGKEMTLRNNFLMLRTDPTSTPHVYFIWEPETTTFTFYYADGLDLNIKLHEGWQIQASVSPWLFGKTCGLCGDSNMETSMEFRTPENYITTNSSVFGFSWMLPGDACNSETCSFTTDFLPVPSKSAFEQRIACLTRYRLPKCLTACKATNFTTITMPTVCVPYSEERKLHDNLKYGKALDFVKIQYHDATVKYPTTCDCPCDHEDIDHHDDHAWYEDLIPGFLYHF